MAGWTATPGTRGPAFLDVLTQPARVDDLLRFLRRMGYEVEEVEYAKVRVTQGSVQGILALKLHLVLRVWMAVNDGAEARIVSE